MVTKQGSGSSVRWLTALVSALGTGIVAYAAILVVTRPHSVLLPPALWHLAFGYGAGVVVGWLVFRWKGADSRIALAVACAGLVAAIVFDHGLRDIPSIARVLPDLWVK